MLNLFTLDADWNIIVSPEALSLLPFKNVMDKYKEREYGIAELSYLYFMVDYRSDFNDLVNDEERSEKILESLAESDKIKIDEVTESAMEFYKGRQPSISLRHLESMKKALHNLQEALEGINLSIQVENAVTGEIEDMYDTLALNRITGIIEKSPKIIAAIKEMEKQVKTELQENNAHRGSGEKSIYEDE